MGRRQRGADKGFPGTILPLFLIPYVNSRPRPEIKREDDLSSRGKRAHILLPRRGRDAGQSPRPNPVPHTGPNPRRG